MELILAATSDYAWSIVLSSSGKKLLPTTKMFPNLHFFSQKCFVSQHNAIDIENVLTKSFVRPFMQKTQISGVFNCNGPRRPVLGARFFIHNSGIRMVGTEC